MPFIQSPKFSVETHAKKSKKRLSIAEPKPNKVEKLLFEEEEELSNANDEEEAEEEEEQLLLEDVLDGAYCFSFFCTVAWVRIYILSFPANVLGSTELQTDDEDEDDDDFYLDDEEFEETEEEVYVSLYLFLFRHIKKDKKK